MLRAAGKMVKMGLPGARGRMSCDPVVADSLRRGVQSETGLTGDRRSWGAASEEQGEKKHAVLRLGLPTVYVVRTLKTKWAGE